jgi:hypothetical protein
MSIGDTLGGIFGSEESSAAASSFSPVGFNAGGILANYAGGTNKFSVDSSKGRKKLFSRLSKTFSRQANEFKNLLPLVKPGFGELTKTRVQAIRDAARSSIGNLGQTLQNRRVFGSSFGQDAISRADAEFAKQEADVKARSFLEELDVTTRLIEKQYNSSARAVQTIIDRLNIDANIATQLSSQATAALQQNAALQAQVAQQNADSGLGVLGTALGFGASFINPASAATGFNASASMLGVSDIVTKNIIRRAGSKNGFDLFEFNYHGDKKRYIGVIAQLVEKVMPEAVSKIHNYKRVNYEMIGVPMVEV